jgi:hypothetical protein
MKVRLAFGVILAFASLQAVWAQQMPDTLWLFKDVITDTEKYWYEIGLCDTFVINTDCFYPTDTGDKYDSTYINFDYQFGNPHPGYAGFKIFWDRGMVTFNATEFDSMIFMHKGPLPGHKVHMIWAKGEGCGGPITYQDFGDFQSSTEWKREAIQFPAGFLKTGLFELRMQIYNDGGTDTTSAPGCLKLDNLGFIRKSTEGVSNAKHAPAVSGTSRYFVPKVSGKVTLAVYSLQGEQLFKGLIDVAAGKRYDVGQFARSNSNLPSQWIHCVQITGSGVNITGKVCR